jgi:hypothetical protein
MKFAKRATNINLHRVDGIREKIISELISRFLLINLYGKAGTGKTTYALQLLGDLLLNSNSKHNYAIWMQAYESFPKKRLKAMYGHRNTLFEYLQNHVLIIPKKPQKDYYALSKLLLNFSSQKVPIASQTKVIIIDNISHHLRYEISKYTDISLVTALLDDFFDSIIFPLLFFCGRNRIKLILTHEVSYNPTRQKTVMFNHHLFDNLKALNIELTKDIFTKKRYINFRFNNIEKKYDFKLDEKGLIF